MGVGTGESQVSVPAFGCGSELNRIERCLPPICSPGTLEQDEDFCQCPRLGQGLHLAVAIVDAGTELRQYVLAQYGQSMEIGLQSHTGQVW